MEYVCSLLLAIGLIAIAMSLFSSGRQRRYYREEYEDLNDATIKLIEACVKIIDKYGQEEELEELTQWLKERISK